jgi:TolA-binding protein
MLQRFLAIALLASPALLAQKPSREIQELQRDVAQLQEEVRTLKQALDQRISAATSQVEAMNKSLTQLNETVGAVRKGVEDQERKLTPLIAAQGTRVDQMSTSFTTMQQAFTDVTAGISRIQTQIADLSNAVKIIATPAPKPPSAEELLKSAEADRLGGKYELAAQGYADFLKSYADSPQADAAQFQLGMAHYQMKDLESAANDFDAVVRNYPKSQRLPDALFYKAKVLRELNRAADSIAACQELRKRFPRNDFARQCSIAR